MFFVFAFSFLSCLSIPQVHKLFDKAHVLVKAAAVLANYTSEAVVERMRPNPDTCKFVSASELASLSKDC